MSTTNDQMIAGYDYKEWVRLESLFLKDYENSTRYNKPFSALISDVLENETYKSFADKTGLSENMLYRLKKQVEEKDPGHREIRLLQFVLPLQIRIYDGHKPCFIVLDWDSIV